MATHAGLDQLARELESSATTVLGAVQAATERNRSQQPAHEQGSDEEEADDEDEDGDGDGEEEEEQNQLLSKLEEVREALRESVRRGKEEHLSRLAFLHQRRLEREFLVRALEQPFPFPLRTTSHRPLTLHLIGAACFGLAVLVLLWVLLEQTAVHQERSLAFYYLHPT